MVIPISTKTERFVGCEIITPLQKIQKNS